MTKQGVLFLPPCVTEAEGLSIYRALAKVNRIIGELRSEFSHSIVNESLIQMFSLKESVQSTRIEGTQVTFLEMVECVDEGRVSWQQREVLNYHRALRHGMEQIQQGYPISTRLIKEMHRILMEGARGTSAAGGEFRRIQNFIGPDNKIEHAVYIPVSADAIDAYMENLEFFVAGTPHRSFQRYRVTDGAVLDETVDSVIKIAIMHAQFESIHPFLDGNGRLGRILIALLAVKEGLVDCPVFLVSEELERERRRYYGLLNGIRGRSPDWHAWIMFFIEASGRMAEGLLQKIQEANALARGGLDRCELDSERSVWLYTFSRPVTTARMAADMCHVSPSTARKCLNLLAEKNLIYADESTQRNRRYTNYGLLRILG